MERKKGKMKFSGSWKELRKIWFPFAPYLTRFSIMNNAERFAQDNHNECFLIYLIETFYEYITQVIEYIIQVTP